MAVDGKPLLGRRRGEGQNRDIARLFDRSGDFPLVLGAIPGDSAGNDLPPFGDEISQDSRVLVIDVKFLVCAESADLTPQERFSLSVAFGSVLGSIWGSVHFFSSLPFFLSPAGQDRKVN